MERGSELPGSEWLDQIMQALEAEMFSEDIARDVHTILAS